jgi:predicted nucleotidyltransferase
MTNPVLKALWEIVQSLEAKQIEYAVMGGIAVRALAIPRPTNDVDVTIACGPQQLPELLCTWDSQSIQVPEIYHTGWLDRIAGMPLIKLKTQISAEHSVDLDIFLCETDFQRSLLSRRQRVELEDRHVWIVTPEDLILLKLIANRPRDLIDIADVFFVQGRLDEPYMYHWAASLGITDRLQNALESC